MSQDWEMDPDVSIDKLLERIRQKRPLIHHITNQVTMNDCANTAYAIGARPTMAFYAPEAMQAAAVADAVVWNLGTFHPEMAEAIRASLPVVCQRAIPVVIDPVAAGAYPGRRDFLLEILAAFEEAYREKQMKCQVIIRCNASELVCLRESLKRPSFPEYHSSQIGGVDDLAMSVDPDRICRDVLQIFQERLPVCVVMTGQTDYIGWTDLFCASPGSEKIDFRLLTVPESCRLLTCMTGAGCMSNTLVAAFASVADPYRYAGYAAQAALTYFVQSAGRAEKSSSGMGTFRMHLMDELSRSVFA